MQKSARFGRRKNERIYVINAPFSSPQKKFKKLNFKIVKMFIICDFWVANAKYYKSLN